MDKLIQAALACPCIHELKEGPCGPAFKAAFSCFHKSTAVPKGFDCYDANVLFAVSNMYSNFT